MDEKYKIVKVHSLKLLKKIADAKEIGLLLFIDKDNYSPEQRPVYKFTGKPSVVKIIDDFVKEYGKNDSSVDEPELWKDFNPEAFYDVDNQQVIVTRNYDVAESVVQVGLGTKLCKVSRDRHGKRCFVFLYDDTIKQLKDEQDAVTRALWEEKYNKKLED